MRIEKNIAVKLSGIILVLLGVSLSENTAAGTGAVNTLIHSGNNPVGCPSSSSDYIGRFNGNIANQFNLAIRMYGASSLVYTAANFQSATGLSISDVNKTVRNNNYQGPETPDYYSAFQLDCGGYGSFINTWTFPQQIIVGGGPNTAYSIDLPSLPTIFDVTYNELWLQVDNASMPVINTWGGIGQLSLAIFIKETSTQQTFQILNQIYDSRPNYNSPAHPAWDSGTNTAYTSALINQNNYLTPGAAEYGFSTAQTGAAPWYNKAFRAQISRGNFVNIINDINSICASHRDAPACLNDFPVPNPLNPYDPLWVNYKLAVVFVLHEVFYTDYGHISMGINASGVGAYQYSRPEAQ